MFGLSAQKPAKLQYGSPDYYVVEAGNFVICAVTNKQIPLDQLKYWNVERQEAYVDGAAMMKRQLEFKG